MTARDSARPSTAEAGREELILRLSEERASRFRAEEEVETLKEDLEDLQEENATAARALRERTDQQKRLQRDIRMQTVIFRHKQERQQSTCGELARRVVEARREVTLALPPKSEPQIREQPVAAAAATAPGEAVDTLRLRLLQLLSVGGSTSWTPRPDQSNPP